MINYLKRLIYLFKLTKKENLTVIIDDLENVKRNMNDIFDEVVSDKEISQYRLELLNRKVCLLEGAQATLAYKYVSYKDGTKELLKENIKILFVLLLSWLIITLLNIPLVALGIIALEFLTVNYPNKLIKNYENTVDDYKKIIRDIDNTTISCNNFIFKRMKAHQDNEGLENNNPKEVKANDFIAYYINNGEMLSVSKEELELAIKILQFELQMDDNNLEVLLKEAKDRVSEESLKEEMFRIRKKSEKNSK